jgi:hypothetical protein
VKGFPSVEIVFNKGGELETPLVFDAVPEEVHGMSQTVTDHPVEQGVNIVDHVKQEPRPLTIHVVITEGALDPQASDTQGPGRVRDQWLTLLNARRLAWLATITTEIETYSNMVLVSAQATRTAIDSSWLKADLTWKQILRVSTRTVEDRIPARARGRAQANRGTVAARPVPATRQRERSDLLQLLDASNARASAPPPS